MRVCLNGHAECQDDYEQRMKFCRECGEPIVSQCQSCQKPLPYPDEFDRYPTPPAHCGQCGKAHEWTERKKQAAIEMFVEEIGSHNDDTRAFEQEVEEISRNTPKAKLAATRLGKLLGKVTTSTANAIRDILVNVASATIADQIRRS